jgi:hypothetical protein
MDAIIVNTVAKFQGIDDHRFIRSRCAPDNLAMAIARETARRV